MHESVNWYGMKSPNLYNTELYNTLGKLKWEAIAVIVVGRDFEQGLIVTECLIGC